MENAKRLLKANAVRVNVRSEPEMKAEYVSSDDENPIQRDEFVVYDNTVIPFGKLKGQFHKVLLEPQNINYSNWLLNQGKNDKFYYRSTCRYLEKKLRPTADNLDITSTDYLYLIDKVNPTPEERKRITYFENNLSSHFVKLHESD